MSTKTSIKRIALVAVSALGFGLLSVVPAKAAIDGAVSTVTNPTVTIALGQTAESTFTVTSTNATSYSNADTITYALAVTTKPAGSTMDVAAPNSSSAASTKVAFKTGGEGTNAGWALSTSTNDRVDTCATGASCGNFGGQIRGTISATPSAAGTYVFTLTTTPKSVAAVTATFTVIVNGQNAAKNAFINKSTTVDDAGSTFSATALGSASSSTTPGVSYTANGAITDSVATMTVPAGAAIVFKLTDGNATDTWSTGSAARLSMNGSTVAELACTISTVTCTLASYTAPTTAGTYNAVLTISGANGSFDPSLTETISFTITVGSAASSFGDFGNAAATTALNVSSVGITKVNSSGRVGQAVSFAPNFTVTNGTAGSLDSNTKAARLRYSVTLPTGTAGSIVDAAVAGVATTNQTVQGKTETLAAGAKNATATVGTTVFFIPATAGTYTVTLFHDANRDALLSAGEASTTATWVILADGLPSITFTKYGSNTTAAQSGDLTDTDSNGDVRNDAGNALKFGQLVKVSLRNGTTPWFLASNESLVLTAADSSTDFQAYTTYTQNAAKMTDAATNASEITLTASNFNADGDAYFNIGNTDNDGGTWTVSATVNGGTAAGAAGSFSITTLRTDSGLTAGTFYTLEGGNTTWKNDNADAGVAGDATDGNSIASTDTSSSWSVRLGVATSVVLKAATITKGEVYNAELTDTLGLMTGLVGAKYALNATTSLTTTPTSTSMSFSIPATTAALASGTTVATLLTDRTNDHTLTVTANTAAATTVSVNPVDLTAAYSIRAAIASSNKFTATVLDQFGNAMPSVAVTAQVTAGRNLQAVATTLFTDANGQVSYTLADTYTGTLLLTDTLKFITNAKEGVVTVNYGTYNPASTVTITGGASADVAPTVTYSYINAGTSGASGTLVKMTATVKDANGATLPAGIPVTWAISGLASTSAIYVDPITGYDWKTSMTDSNGQAITYVYAWGTGTVSVTATAGTVTSATAGKINFANAAADARVVSATVSGNVITAKVVDRYGNAVKGVSLTATRNSGVGYFSGAASSSATGETNANGTVDFIMAGGPANVTVATTTLNFGQTSSAAAAVNGTAITATSIGASLSPAGVQSATVDVTASDPGSLAAEAAADAAAEAIDAANAATDAANLAAEAADAATVAAEEARDAADAATAAVEELATQVATLMAALKAQITTLANTVAKIAKKVKA